MLMIAKGLPIMLKLRCVTVRNQVRSTTILTDRQYSGGIFSNPVNNTTPPVQRSKPLQTSARGT